jgi:S-adenosylmethionine decarboxylase
MEGQDSIGAVAHEVEDHGGAAAAPGREWLVEAHGCDPARLASEDVLRALFDRIVSDLGLTSVGHAAWHTFPCAGGVTGLLLLAESHLACHTFPEFGSLCLNLFCCSARPEWPFGAGLARAVGASYVRVRVVDRPYGPAPTQESVSSSPLPAAEAAAADREQGHPLGAHQQ